MLNAVNQYANDWLLKPKQYIFNIKPKYN
jgi:hypothetical protein